MFDKISAIVLQYGHWEQTARCVDSLLASTLAPTQIIVVDNASTDDSAARIAAFLKQKHDSRLCFLPLKQNRGYAAGNNAGLELAMRSGAEAFLIINNDAYVEPEALEIMRATLAGAGRPGLCGPILVYDDGSVQCLGGGYTNYVTGVSKFYGAGLSLQSALEQPAAEVDRCLNFICGACVLISREFVELAGLMDEDYFLYCEEQDWALAIKNRLQLKFAQGAVVHHEEGASTGWNRRRIAMQPALRLAASRLRLAWKHHPQYLPTVAVGCFFALCKKLFNKLVKNG